jgi:AhpD family alkylhydroperoxidase
LALISIPSPSFAANDATSTYAEAKKMLGTVPASLRAVPEELAAPLWEQLKALDLNPKTALSGRTKELIGFAVAAQIPCMYCVYFHEEAAKLSGATQKELKEAAAVAAIVRQWATIVDGQVGSADGKMMPTAEQEATFKDVEKTMGSVPGFIRRYPAQAIAPAWALYKATMMGQGAVAAKDRALIALAVSAQVPSAPCVESYTGMAKKLGASEQEVQEALAVAASTRAGSVVLNAAHPDLAAFKQEVDGIVKHIKASAKLAHQ